MKKTVFCLLIALLLVACCTQVFAEESNDIITYSQLLKYKQLFDPQMRGSQKYGSVPVKIEAVIGPVVDGDSNTKEFVMWIKDDEGYEPCDKEINPLSDYTLFPEMPKEGQRIIYEITPDAHGYFNGQQIKSYNVIEENVDVSSIAATWAEKNCIPYEDLIRYRELFDPEMGESQEGRKGVWIDVIIGKTDYSGLYGDVVFWIKGNAGYYKYNVVTGYNYKPQTGNRIAYYIHPRYDGEFGKLEYPLCYLIDEEVDVATIEAQGFETDPVAIALNKPFEEENFSAISYKKLMRNYEDLAYSPILVEGICKKVDLKDGFALLKDSDSNYYAIDIRDDILDFKLLVDDEIKVYGYVYELTTTYYRPRGELPRIIAKQIVLLEEE